MNVTYKEHMGSDLSVVNAARVSFGKVSERLTPQDERLIQYLARGYMTSEWDSLLEDLQQLDDRDFLEDILLKVRRHPQHFMPFCHPHITLHVKAPLFVARQLAKHQVGGSWSEISRRYVADEPEFYVPTVYRKRAENVKQGASEETLTIDPQWTGIFTTDDCLTLNGVMKDVRELYKALIRNGVCPEQARMFLPQNMYTEWVWTGSLYFFARVAKQRLDSHTQAETREVAQQISNIIEPLFPVSWEALSLY